MQVTNQVNSAQTKPQTTSFSGLHFKWNNKKEMNKAFDAIASINEKANAKDIWQRTADNLIEINHAKGGVDAKGGVFKANVMHGEKTSVEEAVVAYLEERGHKVRTTLSPRKNLDPKSRDAALKKHQWLA